MARVYRRFLNLFERDINAASIVCKNPTCGWSMIGNREGHGKAMNMKLMAAWLLLGPLTLAQQRSAPSAAINPLAHDEQAIGQGREIYNRTCTVCHGLDGSAGGRAPGLGAGRSYVLRTDEAIFGAIQNGIAGTEMPP